MTVDISGLLTGFARLGQKRREDEAIERDRLAREEAHRAGNIQNLFTLGGAIAGGVIGVGSPAAIGAGASIGGLAGKVATGGTPTAQEVIGAGLATQGAIEQVNINEFNAGQVNETITGIDKTINALVPPKQIEAGPLDKKLAQIDTTSELSSAFESGVFGDESATASLTDQVFTDQLSGQSLTEQIATIDTLDVSDTDKTRIKKLLRTKEGISKLNTQSPNFGKRLTRLTQPITKANDQRILKKVTGFIGENKLNEAIDETINLQSESARKIALTKIDIKSKKDIANITIENKELLEKMKAQRQIDVVKAKGVETRKNKAILDEAKASDKTSKEFNAISKNNKSLLKKNFKYRLGKEEDKLGFEAAADLKTAETRLPRIKKEEVKKEYRRYITIQKSLLTVSGRIKNANTVNELLQLKNDYNQAFILNIIDNKIIRLEK